MFIGATIALYYVNINGREPNNCRGLFCLRKLDVLALQYKQNLLGGNILQS